MSRKLLAALGVRGFLTKPVHPEEMACLVMRLLEIGGMFGETRARDVGT